MLRGAKFAYRMGHLCVAWADTDTHTPIRITYYWPCYATRQDKVDALLGLDAHDEGDGVFAWKEGTGFAGIWQRTRLQNGGSTKPIDVVRQPIPCPKVRKGIETRWVAGRWEKCLKSGWAPA